MVFGWIITLDTIVVLKLTLRFPQEIHKYSTDIIFYQSQVSDKKLFETITCKILIDKNFRFCIFFSTSACFHSFVKWTHWQFTIQWYNHLYWLLFWHLLYSIQLVLNAVEKDTHGARGHQRLNYQQQRDLYTKLNFRLSLLISLQTTNIKFVHI